MSTLVYSDMLNIFLGKAVFTPEDGIQKADVRPTENVDAVVDYKADIHLPYALLRHLLVDGGEPNDADLGVAFSVDPSNDFESNDTSSLFKTFSTAATTRPTTFNLKSACNDAGVDFPAAPTLLHGEYRADPGADDYVENGYTVKFSSLDNTSNATKATSVLPSILAKALGARMYPTDLNGDESLLRLMIQDAGFKNLIKLITGAGVKQNGDTTDLANDIRSSATLDAAKTYDFDTLDGYAGNVNTRPLSHEIVRRVVEAFRADKDNISNDSVARFYDLKGANGEGANDVSILVPTFRTAMPFDVNLQVVLETSLAVTLSANGGSTTMSTAKSPSDAVLGESSPSNHRVLILLNLVFDQ